MTRRLFVSACLLTVLAVSLMAGTAQARTDVRKADPGITATTVTIGGTVPMSGVAAAYASVGRGAEAYFKYVNSRGGVNGRKIEYKLYDDEYDPGKTVQQTRRLVQDDKVFAIFNTLGTEHNLAIRPFLNSLKVPQVFPATGATTFGGNSTRFPWTTGGFQPSYIAEGRLYGRAIGQTKRNAKVAILFQNDDYGKEVVTGVRQGLRFYGRGGKIVATQSYALTDTDVASQITKLRASKADFLVIAATPRWAILAAIATNKIGWKPKIIVNAVASASNTMKIAHLSSGTRLNGAISIVFLKDPNDPAWRNNAAIKLYRQIMARFGTGDVTDVYNVYGMASAHSFVNALQRAGKNPTRASLRKALTSMNQKNNPFLLPGIPVTTTDKDRFPLKHARLQRWDKTRWVGYGKILNARA